MGRVRGSQRYRQETVECVRSRRYTHIRAHIRPAEDVTILSPTNAFNFTPLLASCAVGTLEFRCAVEPASVPVLGVLIETLIIFAFTGQKILSPSGMGHVFILSCPYNQPFCNSLRLPTRPGAML